MTNTINADKHEIIITDNYLRNNKLESSMVLVRMTGILLQWVTVLNKRPMDCEIQLA